MMRLPLAFAALLCAASSAHAGIAIINGGGTGGALGTANAAAGSATLALTTGADAPPGSLIVVGASIRGSAQVSSCTDNSSTPNTYVASSLAVNSSISLRILYTFVATDLPSGGQITCTYNVSNKAESMIAVAFSGAPSVPLDISSLTGTGTGQTYTVGPSGTLACLGGIPNCEVLIGVETSLNSGTVTEDAAFTSLGTVSTNSFMHMGYKIVSINTAITYAPTSTATSGAYSAVLGAFKVPCSRLSATGAGC